MANTLILYDGRQSSAERVANAIGYIIGNVRIAEIGDSPEDISVYDGFCFIFNFYGALTAGKTKSYLLSNRESLLGKRIAFVGMGFSDAGFTKYVVDMEFAVGGDLSITGMFLKDERTTSEIGYQIAKKLRAPVSVMPNAMLNREIDAFICRHTTLALSTGGGARIRCTPLEYLYLDGIFYIISEGGLKFSNILDNSNVSAAIFDEYTDDTQPLAGLQMYGVAEQVERGSEGYWQILSHKGVTPKVLRDLPVTLFVLRIVPMSYEYLNSSFANIGYDARQTLDTKFRAERWEAGYASLHAAKEAEEAEKAAANAKKEPPRRAAFMAERAVREELGQEIRNVLEENAPKKTAQDEEREYQEMSAFIDRNVSADEAGAELLASGVALHQEDDDMPTSNGRETAVYGRDDTVYGVGAGTEEDDLFQKVARALNMSAEEIYKEENVTGEAPVEEGFAEETYEEDTAAEEASVKGESSEGTCVEGTAAGEASAEQIPAEGTNEEETAAEEASVKEESAEGTYDVGIAGGEAFLEGGSAEEIYEKESAAEESPVKEGSAEEIYEKESAAEEASVKGESAEEIYDEESAAGEAPVKEESAEETCEEESAAGEASAKDGSAGEIYEEETAAGAAPVKEEFEEATGEEDNIIGGVSEGELAAEEAHDNEVTGEEASVKGAADEELSEDELAADDTAGEEEAVTWKVNTANKDTVESDEKTAETVTKVDVPSRNDRVEKPQYGGTRTTLGEPLYRNRQTVKDDILSESLEAQNRNLGAEIRKIFSGGGLSFEEQLEKKRAEAEGINPEESDENRTAQKGIFDNEIEYRKSMPRPSSSEAIDEEKIEEPEEEQEPYTLEDLERDTLLAEREEEERKAGGKKETRKGLAGFFRGVTKKEVFEDETFADEFEDIDSDDIDVGDLYEDDDDEKEDEVSRKKKQGGFFSTGFGRSLSRILGIGPDEEEEEEEEDYEEELDEEDDDFDSPDESEGTEPGWMVRLRETREDEDIDSDEVDFSIYGIGNRKEDSDKASAPSEERDDESGSARREKKYSYAGETVYDYDSDTGEVIDDSEVFDSGVDKSASVRAGAEAAVSDSVKDDTDALETYGAQEEDADDNEEAESFIDAPDIEIDAISAALLRSLEEVEKESAADRKRTDGTSEEESKSDDVTEDDGQEDSQEDREPEENDGDGEWNREPEESDGNEDWYQGPEESDGDEDWAQETEESEESDDVMSKLLKTEELPGDDKQVREARESDDDEDWVEEPDVVEEVIRETDSRSESEGIGTDTKVAEPVEEDETLAEEDDGYDDEYEDEDEFEEHSFITNFTDLLRSAIESIRGGSSERSDMPKIRIPGREGKGNKAKAAEEKEREDEPELVELEKFLSERENEISEAGIHSEDEFEEEDAGIEDEMEGEDSEIEDETEDEDSEIEDEMEEEDADLENEMEVKNAYVFADSAKEASAEKLKDASEEVEEAENTEDASEEVKEAEKTEEKEEFGEIEEEEGLVEEAEEDVDEIKEAEDAEEAEETEEEEKTTEEESEDMEQEDDDQEYEDSELDFADDDDSDIIIPGTGVSSGNGIVIRGFDDDEDAEEETEGEDDEEEDGYREEDWKIDYERITHKSKELHRDMPESENRYLDAPEPDDLYYGTFGAAEPSYDEADDAIEAAEPDYDEPDDSTEAAKPDYDEADDATEDAEPDYDEADDATEDAEPDYDETDDIDGDEDWDYDDPDDDSESGYYEFAGDDMDGLDDDDEWEYEEDDDVVDGLYEPV